MTAEFNPKITYKMAAMHLPTPSSTTPEAYLRNWSMSDKDPKVHTLEDLNMRMQNRWPGKYKIVTEAKWNSRNYWINEYVFKFDSPAEETLFRIKYS